jgi:hypothetical protein
MGMVAPEQRIASAYFVVFGNYGDVTRYAAERGVCRQWVYRQAEALRSSLHESQQVQQRLRQELQECREQITTLQTRLAMAVVLDDEKQAEFVTCGQAVGVSLPACWELLTLLHPGPILSVASLGRRTQAAGVKAGELLTVLDACTRERVRETAADEIYVKDPVLMVVEPESLCWAQGRLSDTVSGEAWAEEFRPFPNLEQVTRDGGRGLAKGVAVVSAERVAQGQPAIVDQGDHFHALRSGGVGLRHAERRAQEALANAEAADRTVAACARQGHARTAAATRSRAAWKAAEAAMDEWSARERLWQQTKAALQLFTPAGDLNTRTRAEGVLAATLPQLPDSAFAKVKRALQRPEMLNYLDRVQAKIAALPFPAEVKRAVVRQEGLRRRPELVQGTGTDAAVLRAALLVGAVLLAKVASGQQAVTAIRDILRRAYRASSLVECINSVLRMQQSRHRKMTQGLLDLKRLYWNCHTFRTGRRRKTTPYQRLGVPWPEGMRWWEVLKLTPEQLRDKLSTAKNAN